MSAYDIYLKVGAVLFVIGALVLPILLYAFSRSPASRGYMYHHYTSFYARCLLGWAFFVLLWPAVFALAFVVICFLALVIASLGLDRLVDDRKRGPFYP